MLTPEEMQRITPMMKQYFAIKAEHQDHILFYRLGDFYEMFFDDAIRVSKELELTLTGRDCGLEYRAPMCGVPHHACETYISRLIKRGYKVAICEQLEDPATTKGMVRRGVIRVVTPGTLIESSMLDEGSNNYICCIYCQKDGYGLAFADISTGEIKLTSLEGDDDNGVVNELGRFCPSEVIFNSEFLDKQKIAKFIKDRLACTADMADDYDFYYKNAVQLCLQHFKVTSLQDLGLQDRESMVCTLGGLLGYLHKTQQVGVERLMTLDLYAEDQFMDLGLITRQNLEVTQTIRGGERRGSLLWVLDETNTAMGKRLLKTWIEQPLKNPAAISKRLAAVDELFSKTVLLGEVKNQLTGIYDMERLMTRIIYGNASPRDVRAFGGAISRLPGLVDLLSVCTSGALQDIYNDIDPLHELCDLIDRAIIEEPPVNLKDGGVIKAGYSSDLDSYRELSSNTREVIAAMEARERERTGIKGLKIGYNRVFGYYIEVTKSYLSMVPAEYIRKQTLAGAERYITEELKTLEERVLTAHERILALENSLFQELLRIISAQLPKIQRTAAAVARLDVLASFAQVSSRFGYNRPEVDLSDVIIIKDGRHPVVERMMDGMPFVPNDTKLDCASNQIAIITGPNMAGKSTYMRQTALIVLMAQIGCFVPAKSAHIGVVDGIYTRVGASDDLSAGQSTFMVEMSEVASILKNATRRSLLILDEIGRGTSTFDGMSIARAVVEYIADQRKLGAKTLFATHYHELTELEDIISCVKNYNIAVKKRGDDITFLRRIIPGGADDSYGIEVSKLAGIPEWVIKRAHEVLSQLEEGMAVSTPKIKAKFVSDEEENGQLTLTNPAGDRILERLRGIDENTVSPLEALGILFELKKMM